jgi:hypothetical protein
VGENQRDSIQNRDGKIAMTQAVGGTLVLNGKHAAGVPAEYRVPDNHGYRTAISWTMKPDEKRQRQG